MADIKKDSLLSSIKDNESLNKLFNKLNPVLFKKKDDEKIFIDLLPTDIQKNLDSLGIENSIGLIKLKNYNGTKERYKINYREFIVLNILQIQQLKKEIAELSQRISTLEGQTNKSVDE